MADSFRGCGSTRFPGLPIGLIAGVRQLSGTTGTRQSPRASGASATVGVTGKTRRIMTVAVISENQD
jgi:hypothetical protein